MSNESDEALLARLLDLPATKQEAYLRRAGAERPDLQERLNRLRQALAGPREDLSVGKSFDRPLSDDDCARVMALAFETDEITSMTIGPSTSRPGAQFRDADCPALTCSKLHTSNRVSPFPLIAS